MLNSMQISVMPEIKARALSASSLAYVGDAVYDLYVRTQLVIAFGDWGSNKVNQIKVKCVKASQQARIALALLEELSEVESGVLKRGRNAKSQTVPKNAKLSDYRYATGFETLVGYLALSGQSERLNHVLAKAYGYCDADGLLVVKKELR